MDLMYEFRNLWVALGCQGDYAVEWGARVTSYLQPWRHYHTLGHIYHMLRELKPLVKLMERPDEVLWAAVDHDVVLVPARKGVPVTISEVQSAFFAIESLRVAGVGHETRGRIALKIMATDHKQRHMDGDTKYLVDADMAILGQPWRVYLQNSQDVMQEYVDCGVSRPAFYAGRQDFLRSLDSRHIYHTTHFQELYEQVAHENIGREIQMLIERLQPI